MLNNKGILSRLGSVSCFIIALFILTAPLFQAAGWGQTDNCRSYQETSLSNVGCVGVPVSCPSNYGNPETHQLCVNVSSGAKTCQELTFSETTNLVFTLSGCGTGCNNVSKCRPSTMIGSDPSAQAITNCFAATSVESCPSS